MANTTNYNWETPDDTDLVKDGAAAIRTLGSSVDTTTKALNPSTTLGDIEYRSATANTNTRLAIGTTGQVLSVVGGVPAWATSDDANAIQNAIVDAKGDIVAASAADTPARLAVGTDNQRLVAASGEATGLKYVGDTQNTVIDAAGDLLYGTAADTLGRLAIGTAGQVLKVNSGATAPEWGTAASGATFVGVSLYVTSATTISNNTFTTLTFASEEFDTDGFHDNSTNTDRITIPSGKAGKYLITAKIDIDPATGSSRRDLYIVQKNSGGSAVSDKFMRTASVTGSNIACLQATVFNASVGDYFYLEVYQNSGGNMTIESKMFQATYLGA
jgi:hypothetical protein